MYGQTEASPRMSYYLVKNKTFKNGIIGKPIKGGKFYLSEQNNKIISKSNVIGRLLYKGPTVFLGYANNYLDMESASSIAYGFNSLCCVIIKHSNPCGFGFGKNNLEAYNNAVSTDPISYFGGIVAFNSEVDVEEASKMVKVFLECIIAPSFTTEAINIFSSKKNLRIIELDKNKISSNSNDLAIKSVFNGYLFQEKDQIINRDFNMRYNCH